MAATKNPVLADDHIAIWCPSGDLAGCRNLAVQQFLDGPHDWLWFVDTDMGFAPDTLDRLLDQNVPVVGALYHGLRQGEPDGMGGYHMQPVPMMFRRTPVGYTAHADVADNELIRVDATGAGCLLIHRVALNAIRAKHGDEWFSEHDGLSEDFAFCERLTDLSIPVYVHTGIRANHHKQIWI